MRKKSLIGDKSLVRPLERRPVRPAELKLTREAGGRTRQRPPRALAQRRFQRTLTWTRESTETTTKKSKIIEKIKKSITHEDM